MKTLVVLSPQHRHTSVPDSTLLRRAADFAARTGTGLELFHVVHDSSITGSIFLSDEEIAAEVEALVADERVWVNDLAEGLRALDISVGVDVRWDHPRADAILAKIEESDITLVIKQARDDRFLLGLFSNTDWDLIRRSDVPVWFVQGAFTPESGIVVGIDQVPDRESAEDADVRASLDYEVFRFARALAKDYGRAPLTVVHAYQVPRRIARFASYAPILHQEADADADDSDPPDTARKIAIRHGKAIQAFASFFDFPLADIEIRQGAPHEVVAAEARERGAGLIVMGATERSAWERVFSDVNAEPALAEADCDVVFIKGAAHDG